MSGPDVLVVVGTDHHPFDRAVAWADQWAHAHPGRTVVVQHGSSTAPVEAEGVDFFTPVDLAARMAEAQVVITHGGPGTISAARAAGHKPIVLPRDPKFDEHVDDHQMRFSRWAEEHGLVTLCTDVGTLDALFDIGAGGTRRAGPSGDEDETSNGDLPAVHRFGETIAENIVARRPVSPGGPTILYIGGFGRSGSTLVERLVEEEPHAVSLGEVVHLWSRGLIDDELCGCGRRFSECPFWGAVGERAFGGWDAVDPHAVLALHDAVDRQRRVLRTLRPRSVAARDEILRYTAYYRAVYEAAAAVSGADIVVDSSKHASLALALSNDRHIDLRVLHLVRDSVAVAHSWSKEVNRPETAERADTMVRYSPTGASALWASNNILIDAARLVKTPVFRMRYEDFVRAPGEQLRRMWSALRLPGAFTPDIRAGQGIDLEPGHSIGGNPMRFTRGPLVIHSDDAWRAAMPAKQRHLVKTLTAPVRLWYGYTRRDRRGPGDK